MRALIAGKASCGVTSIALVCQAMACSTAALLPWHVSTGRSLSSLYCTHSAGSYYVASLLCTDLLYAAPARLTEMGFEKLVNEVDAKEAARLGLVTRPLTEAVVQKQLEDLGLEAAFGTHSQIRGLSGAHSHHLSSMHWLDGTKLN